MENHYLNNPEKLADLSPADLVLVELLIDTHYRHRRSYEAVEWPATGDTSADLEAEKICYYLSSRFGVELTSYSAMLGPETIAQLEAFKTKLESVVGA